jgi:hypothetical protein
MPHHALPLGRYQRGGFSLLGSSKTILRVDQQYPTEIFAGNRGELLAVREVEPGKYLVVVYRESQQDGFIITAFLTRKGQALHRRQQLWPL